MKHRIPPSSHAFKSLKKAARLSVLVLALVLALGLTACGTGPGWERTAQAMDDAADNGHPERAAEIGEKYLDQDPANAEVYLKLAEIYANQLNDPDQAAAILEQGAQETHDGQMIEKLQELKGGIAALYPDLEQMLFKPAETTVGGRLFVEMSPQELNDAFPRSNDTYESGAPDSDDWYRSDDYAEYSVSMDSYLGGYYNSMGLTCNLHAFTNRNMAGAPEVVGFGGAARGDSFEAVLQKCGFPQELIDQWSTYSNVTLTFAGDEIDLWQDGTLGEDGYSYQSFTLEYDTGEFYGNVDFYFSDGKLESYGIEKNF